MTEKTKANGIKKILIPVGIIVVVATVVYGLLVAGFIYVGTKEPSQKVALYSSVCGEDISKQYLDAVNRQGGDESAAKLKELKVQIEGLDNWKNDPTCLYIVMQYGIVSADVDLVKGMVLELNAHSEAGINAPYTVQSIGVNVGDAVEAAHSMVLMKENGTNNDGGDQGV